MSNLLTKGRKKLREKEIFLLREKPPYKEGYAVGGGFNLGTLRAVGGWVALDVCLPLGGVAGGGWMGNIKTIKLN